MARTAFLPCTTRVELDDEQSVSRSTNEITIADMGGKIV
ncbi:hypothetical protein CCYS_04520 [Corynebacterium cystitidis DSM 20524]|nr:hypothetical protein CCYS_04520 [Corynebacterium cystitidis DSM 20524]SNV82810.1 Uncharacterised protein [Corynebacterium cystitidis]